MLRRHTQRRSWLRVLFFGPGARVEEREVERVVRTGDGASTRISFLVGSDVAAAFFSNRVVGPGVLETESVTLDLAGKKLTVEALPLYRRDAERLAFTCLPE